MAGRVGLPGGIAHNLKSGLAQGRSQFALFSGEIAVGDESIITDFHEFSGYALHQDLTVTPFYHEFGLNDPMKGGDEVAVGGFTFQLLAYGLYEKAQSFMWALI